MTHEVKAMDEAAQMAEFDALMSGGHETAADDAADAARMEKLSYLYDLEIDVMWAKKQAKSGEL